jgi:predicted nucleotidyltransferase
MSEKLQNEYLAVLEKEARASERVQAIVLIGSYARNTSMPFSDIDVVVIGNLQLGPAPVGIQITQMDAVNLRRRALDGDDFVIWALRLGRPILGEAWWERQKIDLIPRSPWPDPKRNIERARARIRDAKTLEGIGDRDAAHEEGRYAASQLARAVLLSKRVMPASRPELPNQLREVGEDWLGHLVESTMDDTPGRDELALLLSQLQDQLDNKQLLAQI